MSLSESIRKGGANNEAFKRHHIEMIAPLTDFLAASPVIKLLRDLEAHTGGKLGMAYVTYFPDEVKQASQIDKDQKKELNKLGDTGVLLDNPPEQTSTHFYVTKHDLVKYSYGTVNCPSALVVLEYNHEQRSYNRGSLFSPNYTSITCYNALGAAVDKQGEMRLFIRQNLPLYKDSSKETVLIGEDCSNSEKIDTELGKLYDTSPLRIVSF